MKVDFAEDLDPEWPSTAGALTAAAGTGLLLYGSLKDETGPSVAGASALAVGLAVMIVWMPGMHSAEVRWVPAGRRSSLADFSEGR